MEHQKGFRRQTLPHYRKVITSLVSLAEMAVRAGNQRLSDTEKARWAAEVDSALAEIKEAVAGGEEIKGDVDRETEETPVAHNDLEEEIDTMRRELQEAEKELITQEINKEKSRDDLQKARAKLMRATETQNTIATRIAAKETHRNMGIGLILIPFIGIPVVLGASKEIKRLQQLNESTAKWKAKWQVKRDNRANDLEQCYRKIAELKGKLVEEASLREKERKLVMMKKESDELFEAQRTVQHHLNHLTALEGELEVLHSQCTRDTFYGIQAIKGRLQSLFTVLQLGSCDKDLLSDSRVCSELTKLDVRVGDFNSISYN
uniref:cingulin-like protein 1 n=1 Tax=Pristiophorus japonicus TaxID=55135 RepID=UPI00398F18AB